MANRGICAGTEWRREVGHPEQRDGLVDLLRLAAAVLVLAHHLAPLIPGHAGIAFAHLAVDLFFLISGIVVAAAYHAPLRSGMQTCTFVRGRVLRLGPLLIVAGLFSTAEVLARLRFGATLQTVSGLQVFWAVLATFVAAPVPVEPLLGHGNWPLNPPLWSLSVEILIGVLAGAILLRLRSRWLALCAASAGLMLVERCTSVGTLDGGAFLTDLATAMARMVWGFCVGVLIYRHAALLAHKPWRLSIAFASLMALPAFGGASLIGAAEFALVASLQPLLLAKIWIRPVKLNLRGGLLAGELSYAIYVLHWPLISLLRNGARRQHWLGPDTWWSCTLIGLSVVLISALAILCIERPIRAAIKKRGFNTGWGPPLRQR